MIVNRLVTETRTLVDFQNCDTSGDYTPAGNIPDGSPLRDGSSLSTVFSVIHTGVAPARMEADARLRDALAYAAAEAANPHAPDLVWWEMYNDQELGRRAVVLGGSVQRSGRGYLESATTEHRTAMVADLQIVHGPWESVEPVTITGQAEFTGDVMTLPALGTLPGRIARLTVEAVDSVTLTQMFMGIRPFNVGVSAFDPALINPVGSHTFLTNAEETVASNALSALVSSSDYRHYYGRYRLYSLMLSSGNVVSLRVAIAADSASDDAGPLAVIETAPVGVGVTPVYYMGDIDIPWGGQDAMHNSAMIGNHVLTIYATLHDPAPPAGETITVARQTLIPADSWLHCTRVSVSTATNLIVTTGPTARESAWTQLGSSIRNVAVERFNWWYPARGGVLALVAPGSTASGATISVTLEIYPRWHSHRR